MPPVVHPVAASAVDLAASAVDLAAPGVECCDVTRLAFPTPRPQLRVPQAPVTPWPVSPDHRTVSITLIGRHTLARFPRSPHRLHHPHRPSHPGPFPPITAPSPSPSSPALMASSPGSMRGLDPLKLPRAPKRTNDIIDQHLAPSTHFIHVYIYIYLFIYLY